MQAPVSTGITGLLLGGKRVIPNEGMNSTFVKEAEGGAKEAHPVSGMLTMGFIGTTFAMLIAAMVLYFVALRSNPSLMADTGITANLQASGVDIVLLLGGIMYLYLSIRGFKVYRKISNLPVSKIAEAADGLARFSCRPVTEEGRTVKAYFSGVESASASVIFIATTVYSTGRGVQSVDAIEAFVSDSVPTLMDDGSGAYLAVDFKDVANDMSGKTYPLGKALGLSAGLIEMGKEGWISKSDIPMIAQFVSGGCVGGFESIQARLTPPSGSNVRGKLVEQWFPIDAQYDVIGNVSATGKEFRGKEVKLLVTDRSTGIGFVNTSRSSGWHSPLLMYSTLITLFGVCSFALGLSALL